MATFNQSPSGQTSLGLNTISLSLGNGEGNIPIEPNITKYITDGSTGGATIELAFLSPVVPSRRRSIKDVKAS